MIYLTRFLLKVFCPILRKRSSEKDSTNDYKNEGKIQTRMERKIYVSFLYTIKRIRKIFLLVFYIKKGKIFLAAEGKKFEM